MQNLFETVGSAGVEGGQTPSAVARSAQVWFAGGERIVYDSSISRHCCERRRAPQDFLAPGGRSCARRFLPARISGWLIRVGEGSIIFAERKRDAETFSRLCRHGRQRQAQRL